MVSGDPAEELEVPTDSFEFRCESCGESSLMALSAIDRNVLQARCPKCLTNQSVAATLSRLDESTRLQGVMGIVGLVITPIASVWAALLLFMAEPLGAMAILVVLGAITTATIRPALRSGRARPRANAMKYVAIQLGLLFGSPVVAAMIFGYGF